MPKVFIENCIVEYAGHAHNANISLASASPTVKNCVIQYSGSRGIYVDNGSSPLIQDTIFTGNADSPVNIHPVGGQVHRLSGNTGAGNGKNTIEVRGGNITASVTWAKQDFPYAITGDVTVYHTSRTYGEYCRKLTIEPGVEVRFNPGTGLYIGKRLQWYQRLLRSAQCAGDRICAHCLDLKRGHPFPR